MKRLPLYKGVFNYQHEVHTIYCHAASLLQAYRLFMRRLSKIYDCSVVRMIAYFDGSKDNYTIRKEAR
jgi:hypothetical protein